MKAFKSTLTAFTLMAASVAHAQYQVQQQQVAQTTPTGQPLVQQVMLPGQMVPQQVYMGEQPAYAPQMTNNCTVARNDSTTIVVNGDGTTSESGSKRKKNH